MPKSRKKHRKRSSGQGGSQQRRPLAIAARRNITRQLEAQPAGRPSQHHPSGHKDKESTSGLDQSFVLRMTAVRLAPLVIGVLAATGFRFEQFRPLLFLVLVLSLAVLKWVLPWVLNRKALIRQARSGVLSLLVIVVGVVNAVLAESPSVGAVSALALGLFVIAEVISVRGPIGFLTLAVVTTVQMSLFSFLGVFTQSGEWKVAALLLGFVAGVVLAGALLVVYTELLEGAGFSRVRQRVKRDGSSVLRPGSLVLLLTLLIMIAPGTLVLVTPTGLVPFHFLLLIPALLPTPSIISDYFESRMNIGALSKRVIMVVILVEIALAVVSLLLSGGNA